MNGFIKPLGYVPDETENGGGLKLDEKECIKFIGLAYFVKNRKLFDNPVPGRQVNDANRPGESDELEPWIEDLVRWTHFEHFSKGQYQKQAPDYDVTCLQVQRMVLLMAFWLSIFKDESEYSIQVPEWEHTGYIKDKKDGQALMHLRRTPWVTVKAGKKMVVVKCTCKNQASPARCISCVCIKVPGGFCSPLCSCNFVCGKRHPRQRFGAAVGGGRASGSRAGGGGV